MAYPVLTLKADRDVHLRLRHHTIYRTAFDNLDAENGSLVEVRSSEGEFLCYATVNTRAYISGRAVSFEEGDPLVSMKKAMKQSIDMRTALMKDEDTTAMRLINAEGDGIPGLIVDKYGDTVVLQLTTLGMDRMRPWLVNVIAELTGAKLLFEKSTGSARKNEGLEAKEGWLRGKGEDRIIIKERGIEYVISLANSQKTGLFLDQRAMRSLVRDLSKGRTVLDVCSYVGGFSLSALAGGALSADAVDYDGEALERAKEHATLNGYKDDTFMTYQEDAFDFLRRDPLPRTYDFMIVDPPAFAKRDDDLSVAKGAYTDLNRMAPQAIAPGGIMPTCSCSHQMTPALSQTAVFHAALQAKRTVRIIQRHHLAYDHPVNLYHPETDYLKSLLLWVD